MANPRRLIQVRKPGPTPPKLPAVDRSSPQARGLVHAWPTFGGRADVVRDLAGGIHSTLILSISPVPNAELNSRGMKSVDQLNSGNKIALGNAGNPSGQSGLITIVSRVHLTAYTPWAAFFMNRSPQGGTSTGMHLDDSGHLAGFFKGDNDWNLDGPTVPLDEFVVCALSFLPTGQDLIVASKAGVELINVGSNSHDSTGFDFGGPRIGGDPGLGGRALLGWIFDTLIYDRPVSVAEIGKLYNPATRWDLYKDLSRPSTYWVPSAATISLPLTQIRNPRSAAKPLGPVKLDRDSSLSKGLIRGWLFEPGIGGAEAFKGLTGDEKAVTFGSEIDSSDWGVHGELGHGLTGTLADANSNINIGEEIDGESITIAIWAVPTFAFTDSSFPSLFGNLNNSATEGNVLYYQTSIDKFRWLCARSGGLQDCSSSQITSDSQLGRNKTNLFVAGSDAAGAFLDINGVERATSGVTGTYVSAGVNHQILSDSQFDSGSWSGSEHAVMIWNRVLTKAEREMLYDPSTRWSMLKEIRPRILTIPGAAPPSVGFVADLTSASFPMVAQSINVQADYSADLTSASFAMIAQSIDVEADYLANLSAASFPMVAQDIDVIVGFVADLSVALFPMVAQPLTVLADYNADLTSASFAMVAQTLDVAADYLAELSSASFAMTAQSINLSVNFTAQLSTASFPMMAASIDVEADYLADLTSASFPMVGQPLTVDVVGATIVGLVIASIAITPVVRASVRVVPVVAGTATIAPIIRGRARVNREYPL